jgi:2-polyprenyl-3-methyl-5-hydroxy-6-metoxy-1,4-benzoquinol methylase
MKSFYQSMYRRAQMPTQLPWHREFIPPPLVEAAQQQRGGKALDLGCGTGVYATYLALQGCVVTALDFVPAALKMAQQRAEENGVTVNFVEADILEWTTDNNFDLIFDSGCLHGIADLKKRTAYKQRLLDWLTPTGKFVLSHFESRHIFDWRPIGPRRRTRSEITNFFAPDLSEVVYYSEIVPTALPVGPTVKIGHYLFEQAGTK